MKKYVNAEIEVLVFAAEDILTASASVDTEEATTTWETYAQDKFDYVPGTGKGDSIEF